MYVFTKQCLRFDVFTCFSIWLSPITIVDSDGKRYNTKVFVNIRMAKVIKPMLFDLYPDGKHNTTIVFVYDCAYIAMANVIQPMFLFCYSDGKRFYKRKLF